MVLSVSLSPYPAPVNQSVTVTVSAISPGTSVDVGGQVLVDGKNIGTTGTPFRHTFPKRRIRIPGTIPPEFEVVYPPEIVRTAGFPDTAIDLGFPHLKQPAGAITSHYATSASSDDEHVSGAISGHAAPKPPRGWSIGRLDTSPTAHSQAAAFMCR